MTSFLVDFRKDKIFIYTNKNGWKDSTNDIRYFDDVGNCYRVTFKSGKRYPFSYLNVNILRNVTQENVDPFLLGRYVGTKEAYLYLSEKNYYIFGKNFGIKKISKDKIEEFNKYAITQQSIYNYFISLARYHDKATQTDFLESQYEKVKELWNSDNVLADILNTEVKAFDYHKIIYPFSHNLSQMKAICNGMSNSISVIQGPPGTGKTQTILNLISNILIQGKTVAIISNNNRAVYNVYEKMEEAGYGFLCANLGNLENREEFFSKEHNIEKLNLKEVPGNLTELIQKEKKVFEFESNLSSLYNEKEELEFEYKKFAKKNDVSTVKTKKTLSAKELLNLSAILESKGKEKLGFLTRLKYKFKYGISSEYTKNNIPNLTELLKNTSVKKRIDELSCDIKNMENYIAEYKKDDVSNQIINISKYFLNKYLFEKMEQVADIEFNAENFKSNFDMFIQRYPIILSSTYCLPTTVPKRFTFDYIIIDEASQSTITTVLPSLAKGSNLIVIGDDKQLPPVISDEILDFEKMIFSSNKVKEVMRDNGKSFLTFIQKYFDKEVPVTLLKEHYRCPKQIIGFSNTRIYFNQLEIKKNEDGENHLDIIKTLPGNHARKNDLGEGGQYNQREIDEIVELLKELPADKTIGIITPYRRQAELLRKTLPENIEVGTIHTFQGREQQIIIFSTVANSAEDYIKDDEIIKSFINNEQLINVAITRAKEKFILVTSDKIANSSYGILADLVKYICYQTDQVIVEGKVSSVFDILYDEYAETRKNILKTNEIATEEIMENLIKKILEQPEYSSISYSMHVSLKTLIELDKAKYNIEEYQYLNHPWTHLDFVLFNKYDKKPLLAIEVDGVSFHEQNSKQAMHDEIKNRCLNDSMLPLLRLKTNGSNEEQIIIDKLNIILKI